MQEPNGGICYAVSYVYLTHSSLNDTLSVCVGTTNNLLSGGMVDVNSPDDAMVICTFLCEFNFSAHCTVQYGTDPTYMNLQYSAESTETGTAGDSVSVVLREQLNSSTVYYYIVSAVRENVMVTVQRNFTTPHSFSKYKHSDCESIVLSSLKTCNKSFECKHTQFGSFTKPINLHFIVGIISST